MLIIPLGKRGDPSLDFVKISSFTRVKKEVLVYLAQEGLLNESQILKGFPHPSGANGHRFKQFESNQESMMHQIEGWFSK